MNARGWLISSLIILSSFLLMLFVCWKSIEAFEAFDSKGLVAEHYENIADEIESGDHDNEIIASKFRSLAEADLQVERGIASIIDSYYLYIFASFMIGLFQFLLLRLLLSKLKA